MPTPAIPEIEAIERLDVRWPGFLTYVKAQHGYDVDLSYEDLMRVNALMLNDAEGMEILTRSLAVLVARREEPTIGDWLISNGFINRTIVEMQQEMEHIEARIASEEVAPEEKDALVERLFAIVDYANTVQARNANDSARTFMGMKRDPEVH